jgi:glycosyltransferase involved in cell wall biosynthesis
MRHLGRLGAGARRAVGAVKQHPEVVGAHGRACSHGSPWWGAHPATAGVVDPGLRPGILAQMLMHLTPGDHAPTLGAAPAVEARRTPAAVAMARPRVVVTITRLTVGGAQLAVLGMCESLKDEFDIHVVCGPDRGSEGSIQAELERLVPVTVASHLRREMHPAHDVACVSQLRRLYARLAPDIVHSHSSKAGIVSRFASDPGVGVVHTVHGWGHTPADGPLKRLAFTTLERRAARRTDALVAVSSDVRDEGLALGIGSPGQYRVIPPGVDFRPRSPEFPEARRRARAQLGIPMDDHVIGWVGRFVPQKDPATLVAAVATLLRTGDASRRAVLVGDGPLRADAERRLAEFGGRVLFTGLRRDARDLYPAFDVLLHPSLWEGQPLVVQEALAERVPVVTTRVPGVSELVSEDPLGFVVEPGDVPALAERVSRMLADPELSAPVPADAIARLAERNGGPAGSAKLAELYREVMRRRPVRDRA